MGKKRIPVPPGLAGRVLFASDRTCCVCRQPGRKVEIHHIDGDPSNNAFSNLAVVCKDCQSDAHTDHAFARNLTPETVVLYNASWRSIVASRLNPGSSVEALGHRGAAFGDLASTLGVFETTLRWLSHANGHEWIKNPNSRFGEGYEEELDV